jgi:hypothetical protein
MKNLSNVILIVVQYKAHVMSKSHWEDFPGCDTVIFLGVILKQVDHDQSDV